MPKAQTEKPVIKEVTLSDFDIPEAPLPPAEPPRPKPQPQIKTESFITLVVEPDDKVKQNEMPEVDQLENALIGRETIDGDAYDGTVVKPVENILQVVTPPEVDEGNKTWERVEIDAEFPGGLNAWSKYISKEINRNIDELQEEGRSGTVVVQFVVDREGAVSEVSILPCNQSGVANCVGKEAKLSEIAMAAIRRGPKWTPALQNGRNVKAYRRQPITFRLHDGE